MCAFSLPVVFHCCTNCGCDRLPTRVAIRNDSGTVTSATSASSGEIQNIITSTPMMVSSELMSWPIVCWSVCPMLSMSFVARLRTSPRWRLSKYDSGRRDSFAWMSSRIRKTVLLSARLDSRVATAISRPAPRKVHRASPSTEPTAPKSMPWPGVKSIPESMSATPESPLARIASMTCALLLPAGI